MQRLKNILNLYNKNNYFTKNTPLEYNNRLSKKYNANIYLKREDLQKTRSFKLRGAFNKINNLSNIEKNNGVVCVSAGNHAQGVALSCNHLNIGADLFVPENTPIQKIKSIQKFMNNKSNLHVIGKDFDESLNISLEFLDKNKKTFIHPFDDDDIINGQATIAIEILDKIKPDYLLGCIGGGGLMSGVSYYTKNTLDNVKIYGFESENCAAMYQSLISNYIVELSNYDTFVDGASVKKVGAKTFELCKKYVDNIYLIPNGLTCNTMLDLYSNDGIIVEPAGALAVSGLSLLDKNEIRNKNIVIIISGGNNDISRYPEIQELALRYKNLKHYFLIEFSQKPGMLKKFVNDVLDKEDDITLFEYMKKTNKPYGQVLIGIELLKPSNIHNFKLALKANRFKYIHLNENNQQLLSYLV